VRGSHPKGQAALRAAGRAAVFSDLAADAICLGEHDLRYGLPFSCRPRMAGSVHLRWGLLLVCAGSVVVTLLLSMLLQQRGGGNGGGGGATC
jgi:hypothetical protein